MTRPSWGAMLAVLPALLVVLVLLAGGVIIALTQALSPGIGEEGMMTLAHFREVTTAPGFGRSLLLTLWVSFVSTVLTVVLAVLTALSLRSMKSFQRIATFVYQIPLTLPHMVVAAAGIMLLSQSGLFSRLLTAGGLIDMPSRFPELVFDRSGIGIIIVYVWKQVPFVGLFALSVLQSVGADYEAAARTLGARPLQAVRHVLVPLVMPGLLPSSIIIFAFVFGAFEVPLLLGARFPSMISVLAYRLYTDVDLALRPQSMALSFVIALIVLLLIVAYRSILTALTRRGVARSTA